MKFLSFVFLTAFLGTAFADSPEIIGIDCTNNKILNTLTIKASIRFQGDDKTTVEIQTSKESEPTILKQANQANQDGLFVFTPEGNHPFRNTKDGVIIAIPSNFAGFMSYRGYTVGISCEYATR